MFFCFGPPVKMHQYPETDQIANGFIHEYYLDNIDINKLSESKKSKLRSSKIGILDITKTIAAGDGCCHLHFHK